MRIGRRARSIATTAALLGAVAGIGGTPTAVAAATPGPAVSCSGWSTTHDNPGTYAYLNGTYNLKKGPYASCGNVTSVASGTKFWVWCVTWNDYGNTWYYGRIAGTDTKGWMSADNLDGWGGNFGYSVC